VHNGDFANYHSVTEYLAERNIVPLFLTDTEVSILVFDLWNRVYKYPLEYIFEGLAPTGEHDFDMLPKDKQEVYRQIQRAHIHASPDGPWFFIIAQNDVASDSFRLMGITDTAMLRPQVFALQDGEVQVGLVCSEKQAIDATLASLASEDSRFCTIADDYWNARGASYTDGGAFVFTLKRDGDGSRRLVCADKFGRERRAESGEQRAGRREEGTGNSVPALLADESGIALHEALRNAADTMGLEEFRSLCGEVAGRARTDAEVTSVVNGLTLAIDRRYPTGENRRARILEAVTQALVSVFEAGPSIAGDGTGHFARIDWETRDALREPRGSEEVLVVNAHDFPPEGDDCDSRLVVKARELGWRRFMCYGYAGQRFVACGLGPGTEGVVIDAYGSSGDYLGSGLDGATVIVHGNAQDQVAQIIKEGKLVVHGDVGQTFMYGAKGGAVFVKGNAAGRPLINAVGRPKAIINGTCLDFLAESFMAGDPLAGGGFVILNGVRFGADGELIDLDTPYPGSNLFSLASGGAIYVRDPRGLLDDEQLNGGEYVELTDADWKLIKPYLEENERLFDIPVSRLLTVEGILREPRDVYRKVAPIKRKAAAAAGAVPDDDTNVGEVSDG
jgi:glutamate synthase domain-containing protein 3